MRGEFNQNPCSSQAGADRDRNPGDWRARSPGGASVPAALCPHSLQSGAPADPSQAPMQSYEEERCLLPPRTGSPHSGGLGTSLRPKGTKKHQGAVGVFFQHQIHELFLKLTDIFLHPAHLPSGNTGSQGPLAALGPFQLPTRQARARLTREPVIKCW